MLDDVQLFVKMMRDAKAGAKAVKGAGEAYLYRPSGFTDTEYKAYLHRAECLPTVDRTLAGLLGRAFNEEPNISETEVDVNALDASGDSLLRVLRWVMEEVLLVASCGLLAEFDEAPKLARYKREHILDWHFENSKLVYLVLDQSRSVFEDGERRWLVENLVLSIQDGFLVSELFQVEDEKTGKMVLIERLEPRAVGQRLDFIPFQFVGDPTVLTSTLSPIAGLVIDYMDLSAQERWLLAKVASPQFAIEWDKETDVGDAQAFLEANMQADGAIHIGAGSILQLIGASAKYVEVQGGGIDKIRQAKEDTKSQLIAAGARSLADQTQSNLAAETVRIQNSGEGAVLSDIVSLTNTDFNRFMEMLAVYTQQDPVVVTLSQNFFAEKLSVQDLLQVVGAWQGGGVPIDLVHTAATMAGLTEDNLEEYTDKLESSL